MCTDSNCIYQPGRHILGRLAHGDDLNGAVQSIAENHAITQAVFSIVGCVSCATTGVFDQKQQVYITERSEKPFDIISCSGCICREEKEIRVYTHAVLIDNDGLVSGGRLFSPTLIFGAEVVLNELVGPELQKTYDLTTGMVLWSFPP